MRFWLARTATRTLAATHRGRPLPANYHPLAVGSRHEDLPLLGCRRRWLGVAKRRRVLGHLPIHVFQTVRVLLEPEHAFDGLVHLC